MLSYAGRVLARFLAVRGHVPRHGDVDQHDVPGGAPSSAIRKTPFANGGFQIRLGGNFMFLLFWGGSCIKEASVIPQKPKLSGAIAAPPRK